MNTHSHAHVVPFATTQRMPFTERIAGAEPELEQAVRT